jgi:large subunit ribosomal protein L21
VYAVVQSGGQQHKVRVGQTFLVEKIAGAAEAGARVELDRVLAIGGDGGSAIGTPTVAGARVIAEVVDPDAKGKKLIVFKYKAKVRYRRKTGHRQHYTQLKVTEIVPGDGSTGEAGAAGTVGDAASQAAEAVEDAASGAAGTVRDAAEPAGQPADQGAGQPADETPGITPGLVAEATRDVAAVAAEAAADLGGQALERAQDAASDALETVVDRVRDILPGGDDDDSRDKKD